MMAAVINVALSHAFVGKMSAPVSVPNLEVSGGGGGGVNPGHPLDPPLSPAGYLQVF